MEVMGAARDALDEPLPLAEPFHRVHVLLLHTLLQPGCVAAAQCNLLCSE